MVGEPAFGGTIHPARSSSRSRPARKVQSVPGLQPEGYFQTTLAMLRPRALPPGLAEGRPCGWDRLSKGLSAKSTTSEKSAYKGQRTKLEPRWTDERGPERGKKVRSLNYTRQLRDFSGSTKNNGLRFDLFVRAPTYSDPGTALSGPLARAEARGEINLRFIP
jgi:hypothetical protein